MFVSNINVLTQVATDHRRVTLSVQATVQVNNGHALTSNYEMTNRGGDLGTTNHVSSFVRTLDSSKAERCVGFQCHMKVCI